MANDIVGTRSPNGAVGVFGVVDSGELAAFNAWSIPAYNPPTVGGVIRGFGLVASGLTVNAGGSTTVQDVAVARNSAGESDCLVGSGPSIQFTIPVAPGTSGQSRIDALVLWKDTTVVSALNNGYDAVGYQVVSGTAATSPVEPTEATIRAAIPNGATAMISVLGTARIAYGQVAPSTLTINYSSIDATNLPQISQLQGSLPLTQTSGTLALNRGGTGQTTAALARNALGLGNTTGPVPLANGGTQVSGVVSPSNIVFRGLTISMRKWSLLCMITIAGTLTDVWPAGTAINIPANMRPFIDVIGKYIVSTSGGEIDIRAAGAIVPNKSHSSGESIYATVTYMGAVVA